MQIPESGAHSFRLLRAHAQPKQMHPLRERGRIRKHAVVSGSRVQLLAAEHEWSGGATESSNVREEVQVIERNLEGLHSSHR